LDTGLSSSYFTDADQLLVTPNGTSPGSLNSSNSVTAPAQRTNRRYKTQLRDFLSTCRSKRKVSGAANLQTSNPAAAGQLSSPSPAVVDYIPDPAAVAVAYSNLNPMYSSSPVPYGAASTENLYMTQSIHSGSFYPSAENLFHQYRLQGGYYPDYHHHHHHHPSSPYVANGFLPYDGYGLASPVVNAKEEKWHDEKFYNNSNSSDLSHSTNGRHNFNYDASSQQPVNALSLKSRQCFTSIIK
jgi:aryl hydrocarbon receptor